jgi:hypothetical protein
VLEGRVIRDIVSATFTSRRDVELITDHGEDWASAAVELASQCKEWSQGKI